MQVGSRRHKKIEWDFKLGLILPNDDPWHNPQCVDLTHDLWVAVVSQDLRSYLNLWILWHNLRGVVLVHNPWVEVMHQSSKTLWGLSISTARLTSHGLDSRLMGWVHEEISMSIKYPFILTSLVHMACTLVKTCRLHSLGNLPRLI